MTLVLTGTVTFHSGDIVGLLEYDCGNEQLVRIYDRIQECEYVVWVRREQLVSLLFPESECLSRVAA